MVGFGGIGGGGPTAMANGGETGAGVGAILGLGESFPCCRVLMSGLQGLQHLGDGDDGSTLVSGT